MRRRRSAHLVALLMLLFGLAWADQAHSYTRAIGPITKLPVRWEQMPIDLRVAGRTLPAGVSLAAVTTALTQALDVWKQQASCAKLSFVVGTTTDDRVADDGVNIVSFRNRAWCPNGVERSAGCYDPRLAALTTLHIRGDSKRESIVGADIELNGVSFDFVSGSQSLDNPKNGIDLVAALAHELGHLLGFGHPCAAPGERKQAYRTETGNDLLPCAASALESPSGTSLMSPLHDRSVKAPRLTADDQRAVCDVYPNAASAPAVVADGCGGCSLRAAEVTPVQFIGGLVTCIVFAARRITALRRGRASWARRSEHVRRG